MTAVVARSEGQTMAVGPGDGIEAIVFDLGGVVFDIDFGRAFASWGGATGCDPAVLQARCRHDDAGGVAYETGKLGDAAFFAGLRTALGVEVTDAALLEGWNAIIGSALPGIAGALESAAARWPLYAFSNTNTAHQRFFTARFAGVLGNFRQVFASCDIGLRKPDAAAFRFVVDAIGVPAPRLLFFDDLAANVDGARACGIRAVQVTGPSTVADTLAALAR